MNRHNLAENIAKFRLRYSRGMSLIGFIIDAAKMSVYFGGAVFLFFGSPPTKVEMVVFGLLFIVGNVVLGYADETAGFWKFENEYSSKELNPYFEKKFEELKTNK